MGVTKMPRNQSKRTLLEGGARHTVIVHNSGSTNMKTISAFLSLALGTLVGFLATHRALAGAPAGGAPQKQIDGLRTYSSLDRPEPGKEDVLPPGTIKFQGAGVVDVLKVYQSLSGRMLISSENLPTPAVTLENTHPLTRREALQLLDTALAQSGITMIPQGASIIKAVPLAQAPTESAPIPDLTPEQLPESLSYMTYVVELKGLKPNSILPVLMPFSKAPSSLVVHVDSDLLIIRDYSANVRRMLYILQRVERGHKARLSE